MEDGFVNLNLEMEFDLEGMAVMWKLWESTLMVVLRTGEIAVYSIEGEQRLLAKTEPNMLVIYQSPCFIFRLVARTRTRTCNLLSRDIFFCSSEVVSNSLARASYWLVSLH